MENGLTVWFCFGVGVIDVIDYVCAGTRFRVRTRFANHLIFLLAWSRAVHMDVLEKYILCAINPTCDIIWVWQHGLRIAESNPKLKLFVRTDIDFER